MSRSETIEPYDSYIFKFLKNIQTDFHLTLFLPPPVVNEESSLPTSCHLFSDLLMRVIMTPVKWSLKVILICISLMFSDMKFVISLDTHWSLFFLFFLPSFLFFLSFLKLSVHFMCQFVDWHFYFTGTKVFVPYQMIFVWWMKWIYTHSFANRIQVWQHHSLNRLPLFNVYFAFLVKN